MLIAEELLLVGSDERGRNLMGTSRNLAVAGAFLTELAVRERLAVQDKRLRVLDPGSVGDHLLDDALVRFTEQEGKRPKDVLDRIGKQLHQPVLDSLVRQELVRPDPVKVLGVTLTTLWPALPGGRREAILADLGRVLTGAQEADTRTGALISLLHAVDALRKAVPEDLRPGLSTRDVKRRGKEVLEGRWAPESVARAVEEAAAAMVAIMAATGAASG